MSDYYSQTIDYGPLFSSARMEFRQPKVAARAPSVAGSVTSAQAADSLDGDTLTRLHRQLLEYLARQADGATDEEQQLALQMNPSTQRPRRIELVRRGLVVEAGTRKTRSGRNASVWRVA